MSTRISKQMDLVALLLVLSGTVLLALTFVRPTPAEPKGFELSEVLNFKVDDTWSVLTKGFTFTHDAPRREDSSILAVFALHAKVCPPCINEVVEYVELLEGLATDGVEIDPLAMVFETDAGRAQRFLRVADLPLPAAYGASEELADLLGRLEETQPLQQIVFIDPSRGTWFFKVALPNRMTPREYKESVLRQMLAAQKEERG